MFNDTMSHCLWLFQDLKKRSQIYIYIWMLNPTPLEFPVPVITCAGGSRTALRPCSGAPLHAGPSGLGFQRALCGRLQSAGSALSAGPESSPFPWLPKERKREKRHCEWGTGRGREREGKWRMTNEEEVEDGMRKELQQKWWEQEKEWKRERNICSTRSCTDRKMLALSFLIRDNGQVCSSQIASNSLAFTEICKDFAAAQNLII